jgi:CDP-diacylglycerol---glycerol-3-phosphate 3-phosphatidyltransferase
VNLANRITIARIFLVPVVMFFLLMKYDLFHFTINGRITTGSELIAALVFIIAASTDGLDGYIARKRKLITNLGKLLDPLADKLLVSAALIALVEKQLVSSWMVIIIISREFAVTGLRAIAAAEGTVLAASKLAKWKTATQIIGIVAIMLNNFPFSYIRFPFDQLMMYLAVLMTLLSGIDYFVKNKHAIHMDV